MSDYEQHIGKAKFLPVNNADELEALAKTICDKHNFEKKSFYKDYVELLTDQGHLLYVVTEKGIYEIISTYDIDEYEDIFHAEKTPDDEISFVLRYYNGGCGFDEAFNEAIKKLEN